MPFPQEEYDVPPQGSFARPSGPPGARTANPGTHRRRVRRSPCFIPRSPRVRAAPRGTSHLPRGPTSPAEALGPDRLPSEPILGLRRYGARWRSRRRSRAHAASSRWSRGSWRRQGCSPGSRSVPGSSSTGRSLGRGWSQRPRTTTHGGAVHASGCSSTIASRSSGRISRADRRGNGLCLGPEGGAVPPGRRSRCWWWSARTEADPRRRLPRSRVESPPSVRCAAAVSTSCT